MEKENALNEVFLCLGRSRRRKTYLAEIYRARGRFRRSFVVLRVHGTGCDQKTQRQQRSTEGKTHFKYLGVFHGTRQGTANKVHIANPGRTADAMGELGAANSA